MKFQYHFIFFLFYVFYSLIEKIYFSILDYLYNVLTVSNKSSPKHSLPLSWGYSLVLQPLPGQCKVLSLIPVFKNFTIIV